MELDITLLGQTGTRYPYRMMPPETQWDSRKDAAAVYVFMSASRRVLYVGQTGSLADRRPGHRHGKWVPIAGETPAYLLVHANGKDDAARRQEERDLIARYQPPANVQHMSKFNAKHGLLGLFEAPARTVTSSEIAAKHGLLGSVKPLEL